MFLYVACGIVVASAIIFAIKKYVDMLIIIQIIHSRGIEISEEEIRNTSAYVIRRLFNR